MNVAPKPPKEGSKTQNSSFLCKIALRLKKVCHKVYLCENHPQQSCKAFIYVYVRVYKWLVDDIPSTRQFGGYWLTHPLAKRRFSIYFRS